MLSVALAAHSAAQASGSAELVAAADERNCLAVVEMELSQGPISADRRDSAAAVAEHCRSCREKHQRASKRYMGLSQSRNSQYLTCFSETHRLMESHELKYRQTSQMFTQYLERSLHSAQQMNASPEYVQNLADLIELWREKRESAAQPAIPGLHIYRFKIPE